MHSAYHDEERLSYTSRLEPKSKPIESHVKDVDGVTCGVQAKHLCNACRSQIRREYDVDNCTHQNPKSWVKEQIRKWADIAYSL